ncbi:hypothetical protein SynROS8604_01934 [Synechococcus sp. ROS8604]|nr:hypothetical protein SynROS8604_01934 [Synechococcus sp. ROS8604]
MFFGEVYWLCNCLDMIFKSLLASLIVNEALCIADWLQGFVGLSNVHAD